MGDTFHCFSWKGSFWGAFSAAVFGARRSEPGGRAPTRSKHRARMRGLHIRASPPPAVAAIEARQLDRAKPDPPALFILLQADSLPDQDVTEKDAPVAQIHIPVLLHPAHLKPIRILDLGQSRRIRPRRRRIHTRRRPHVQRLMRALLVVDPSETVESSLLGASCGLRRLRRVLLQGAMQPLVPAVLFRVSGLDPFRQHAEPDVPHTQPAQPAQTDRRERRSVVAAQCPR